MNLARKIILSIWIPFTVIFPISRVEFSTLGVKVSKYCILGDSPWFWYISLLATGIYLLVLWEKQT